MKLGNVSQTVVPVPNFFLDRKTRPIETFKTATNSEIDITEYSKRKNSYKKKYKKNKRNSSYYRDKDILSFNLDININHNPRSFSRQFTNSNQEKYVPLYHRNKYKSNVDLKETYFPDIIDTNKNPSKPEKELNSIILKNFKDYKKKSNLEEFLNPNLREDLMYNTKNLLERINMNYDVKQWTNFDSRTTLNRFCQTAYSPLTDVINNTKSDKEQFSNTLKNKALSLKTIGNNTKTVLEKTLKQKEFEDNINQCNAEIEKNNVDELLDNSRSNLLKLKYNNCDAPKYNKIDSKFIKETKVITEQINKTKLYKDFPSSTRAEFNEKRVIPNKKLLKLNEFDNSKGCISKEKYGYSNVNSNGNEMLNCQDAMWIRPLHKDAFK